MSHDAMDRPGVSLSRPPPSLSRPGSTRIHTDHESLHTVDVDEGFMPQPNWWSQVRYTLREPFAEFLGTLILVLFGNGANLQAFLSLNTHVTATPRGDFLSLNFGWAVGVAMGVWVCAGVSGGHVNPAVTIALATFRGFPWKKVPVYILAQVTGALFGAGIAYADYFHAINLVEGGPALRTIAKTGDLFASYPLSFLTSISCFSDEFMVTAVLMVGILAVTDKRNAPAPAGLLPLSLFILVLGIGTSMGMNTSYAANPARDLGPRILTAMVGYGTEVFSFRGQYWLWCPLLGPVLGALFGTFVYDTLIYTGGDSILNKPNAQATKESHGSLASRRGKMADVYA